MDDSQLLEARKLLLEAHQLWWNSHGAEGAQLDLSGENLRGANFAKCDFQAAKFTGADLKYASFENADLNGSNIDGAVIRWTDLVRAVEKSGNTPKR